MARIYDKVYFGDEIVDSAAATLHVGSSAVLYGLSVYTVFHVAEQDGELRAFRLPEHYERLMNSCRIIGIDTFAVDWTYERFVEAVKQLIAANHPTEDCFVRASLHIDALVPGTRSRGLPAKLSMFVYEAVPIVPQDGARLKTSVWRRTPDYSIPSRAKVNGAYVNSVLAKQDALDSGYDDCIFLDAAGHVTELSAANIFVIRGNTLITSGTSSDILEGINRRSIIELARDLGLETVERDIDLTELYVADEAFVCGTSAFITPVTEVDARKLPSTHPIVDQLAVAHRSALREPSDKQWLTRVDI